MNLTNSRVLVTGANRGIGRSLVESLLQQGAQTIYAGVRNLEDLPDFGSERVLPLVLDVADPNSVRRAAGQVRALNLLINNAGVLDFGDILTVSNAQLERNFNVNFYGVLNMARQFAPMLAQQQGAIVNLLTLLALVSAPGMAAYNASKAAAWSLHLSLRASLAAQQVRVYGVFPGAVDTAMLAGVDMPKTSSSAVAQAILQGLAQDQEDIFPDPMSQAVYASWCSDHKAVEKQFAQL